MDSNYDNNQGHSGAMNSSVASMLGMRSNGAEVVEEAPPMRAVALMTTQAAPSLQFTSGAGPKFGKAPPLGISRPSQGLRGRSLSAGIAVKQEWNESNWKVSHLEQVPQDFPLERTHREIPDVEASEVATRISNTLRLLSVQAEYDGEKAKAKCTTSDMVSFRIRLFAGGEGGLPVVVEIQRRNGSPSSFMRVCRHILDGAEGIEVKPATEPPRKQMPPFMKGPVGGMKCLQSVMLKSDPEADLNNGLQKSMELIRSKHKDSNVLGLENLCLLTDPLKTRSDVAVKACKAVLLDQKCAEIREEIGVTLQKDAFLPEEFDDDDAGRNLMEKSRHMALVLLSNALVLTCKDGCLAEAVKSEKWFSDFLFSTLLDEIKGFETSPNNAYEAACGLTGLVSCSDIARKFLVDNSAVDDLRAAHNYGLHNHELLANECERTLIAMGESV